MNSESDWLHHDHRAFEAMLAECEMAAEHEDWKAVGLLFKELVEHLKSHMQMEEEVLYPAYENLTDASHSPTVALRREHDEIVRMVRDLSRVLVSNNSEVFLEALRPLDKVMMTHHDKEEEIFLPMAGHALLQQRDEILEKMKRLDAAKGKRKWDV